MISQDLLIHSDSHYRSGIDCSSILCPEFPAYQSGLPERLSMFHDIRSRFAWSHRSI